MEFLWIRWLGPEPSHDVGWKALRLDRVGFIGEEENSPSFGFLDPVNVIRAAHLIPAFFHGRTNKFLGPSLIRELAENDDWESFYVNQFVDCDMFMRDLGGGIGHSGQKRSNIHWQMSDAPTIREEDGEADVVEENEMRADSDEERDEEDEEGEEDLSDIEL